MSTPRLFTVLGDLNVRRNMTGLNTASRDIMKSAQVIACDNLPAFDAALCEVKAESSVVIIACVTEMLLIGDDSGTVASSIESVLSSFKTKISSFCSVRPGVQVTVAPPLYRHLPFWYQRNLAQISGLFSCILSNGVPQNLSLLSSFCSQDLMPDGVFLTPVSGLHYVLHLFDNTVQVLSSCAAPQDVQMYTVREVCRQHDDRLVFLEQRHGRLDARLDLKTAADAEFNDWQTNRSEEDWFTILGAQRLSSDLSSRDWQRAVKKQLSEIIKIVLNATKSRVEYTILYVVNPIRGRSTGLPVLNVRLSSADASRRIRDIFSGFFGRNAKFPLPPSLKGISIRNKVTLDTRVRIAILRQLGLRFQETNGSGSSFKVKGYDPRPLLVTTPASRGARPRTHNFIEAVQQLPSQLSDEALMIIHQIIGERHPGALQSLFVVLQDDDRSRIEHLILEKRKSARPSGHAPSTPAVLTGHTSGLGTGMDVSSSLALLRLPPPPPPPLPASLRRSRSGTPVEARSRSSPRRRSRKSSSRSRSPIKSRSRSSPSRRSRKSKKVNKSQGLKRRHLSSSDERHKSSRRFKRRRTSVRGRGRRSSSSSSGASSTPTGPRHSSSSGSSTSSDSTRASRRSRSRER